MDEPLPEPPSAPTVADLLHHATPTVWVTPALAALIVLAFVLEVTLGHVAPMSPTAAELLAVGGSFGPQVVDGQWWRLLSATFLHAGVIHLVMNLWVLLQGGPLAERLFGNLGFLAIYFLSGIGASLLSVTLHPLTVSVGASGAIFGIFGALLVYTTTHRGLIPRELLIKQRNGILAFIGYNVIYGLADSNIDLAGHAGGFIVGSVAGLLMTRDLITPRLGARRRAVMAVLLFAVLAVCGLGARRRVHQVPEVAADRLADQAVGEYNAKRYQESLEHFTQALALVPAKEPPSWWRLRGLAEWQLMKPREALADWKRVLAQGPMPELSDLQCDASRQLETPTAAELEEGIGFCTSAFALHPDVGDALWARAMLFRRAKRFTEALADLDKAITLEPKLAGLYVERAWVNEALGNYRAGIADLDHHEELEPDSAGVLNNRAWLKVLAGDFAGARADANRSLELRPDDRNTLGTRCFAQFGLGQKAPARADCARSVALCQGENCHIDAGMLALLDGRRSDARREWELAAQVNPQNEKELAPFMARTR